MPEVPFLLPTNLITEFVPLQLLVNRMLAASFPLFFILSLFIFFFFFLGVVTTIAGAGSPGYLDGVGSNAVFNAPSCIAIRNNGNLLVTEFRGHRVRMVLSSGEESSFLFLKFECSSLVVYSCDFFNMYLI